jgi:transposase
MLSLAVFIAGSYNKIEVVNMQYEQKVGHYVGLDVHKKTVYGFVLDKEGNRLFEKEFDTEPQDLDAFMLRVPKDDSIVAIESCICWQHVYNYLSNAGYKIALAHPVGVKALKKLRRHTDRDDARLLADLLRTNMLPLSYAPPEDIRIKRQITRHRHSITNVETQIMNKIHAILLRHGIHNLPYRDAFCKKGIQFLLDLDLPGCDRFEMDRYIEMVQMFEAKISESTERIEEIAVDDPAIRLVMTMPGMGYYNATTFVGEIGDIRRFDNKDKVASFAGLAPRVHQSGEKTKLGHITKQGNKGLRWVMIQAANTAIQYDKTLKKMYERLAPKKGHQKAVVAVARRMVTLLYVMLKHNIEYQALQIHKAS